MSSRIRDLALEASVEYIASPEWVFNDAELERFGKMIVQECIDIVTSEVERNRLEDRYQMNAGDVRYTLEMQNAFAEKIQQHFGVE